MDFKKYLEGLNHPTSTVEGYSTAISHINNEFNVNIYEMNYVEVEVFERKHLRKSKWFEVHNKKWKGTLSSSVKKYKEFCKIK